MEDGLLPSDINLFPEDAEDVDPTSAYSWRINHQIGDHKTTAARTAQTRDEFYSMFFLDYLGIIGRPLQPLTRPSERFFDNITIGFRSWRAPYTASSCTTSSHFPLNIAHSGLRRPRAGTPGATGGRLPAQCAAGASRRGTGLLHQDNLPDRKVAGRGIEPSWQLDGPSTQTITLNKWTTIQHEFMAWWDEHVQAHSYNPFWTKNQPAFHAQESRLGPDFESDSGSDSHSSPAHPLPNAGPTRLLEQPAGQRSPQDPSVSKSFAQERRRIEQEITTHEVAYRMEQVLSMDVSELLPAHRQFRTVVQPIFQLMQFFLRKSQSYLHLLWLFRPAVFPGVLGAPADHAVLGWPYQKEWRCWTAGTVLLHWDGHGADAVHAASPGDNGQPCARWVAVCAATAARPPDGGWNPAPRPVAAQPYWTADPAPRGRTGVALRSGCGDGAAQSSVVPGIQHRGIQGPHGATEFLKEVFWDLWIPQSGSLSGISCSLGCPRDGVPDPAALGADPPPTRGNVSRATGAGDSPRAAGFRALKPAAIEAADRAGRPVKRQVMGSGCAIPFQQVWGIFREKFAQQMRMFERGNRQVLEDYQVALNCREAMGDPLWDVLLLLVLLDGSRRPGRRLTYGRHHPQVRAPLRPRRSPLDVQPGWSGYRSVRPVELHRGGLQTPPIPLPGLTGVGKTFTVEAIAEWFKLPLYSISAGELIVDHGDLYALEYQLDMIFKVAKHFNAVILFDEADAFMERRTSYLDAYNRLLTVLLRKLEYYEGILFLTSNRAIEFDDAVLSRIHLKIKYEDLTEESRKEVWRHFTSKACTPKGPSIINDDDLCRLGHIALNGREIKNLTSIAHALATVDRKQMSYEHLELAAKSTEKFETEFIDHLNVCVHPHGDHNAVPMLVILCVIMLMFPKRIEPKVESMFVSSITSGSGSLITLEPPDVHMAAERQQDEAMTLSCGFHSQAQGFANEIPLSATMNTILPDLPLSEFKLGLGVLKPDERLPKKMYADVVAVGKDEDWVLNHWLLKDVIMEPVPPSVRNSARWSPKTSLDTTKLVTIDTDIKNSCAELTMDMLQESAEDRGTDHCLCVGISPYKNGVLPTFAGVMSYSPLTCIGCTPSVQVLSQVMSLVAVVIEQAFMRESRNTDTMISTSTRPEPRPSSRSGPEHGLGLQPVREPDAADRAQEPLLVCDQRDEQGRRRAHQHGPEPERGVIAGPAYGHKEEHNRPDVLNSIIRP
ncbi:uncharacterized protein CDV56_101773 [Aspergillus thermomutatus]|uniref:AAA+ ATPase domain-containing protein n=1 Tax=Aspergillus thermomutatus TaxID=41047 RepID=A0A397G5J9_ASPTH|nr:uncharacterized protein CDV56_101773 [Aspergillus thermomutatus]RHZ44626.1 hypothetical protein CDV56_101773 [Aspergillus thermomutatus]